MSTLWRKSAAVEFDRNGDRAIGATVSFFAGNTTTPLTVYQDADEATPHEADIETDGYGRWPDIYIPFTTSFDEKALTSGGVQLWYTRGIPNPDPVEAALGTVEASQLLQTGDVIWAPVDETRAGFVRLNGRTIGNSSSGGSERANDDTSPLFTYLWNKLGNSQAAVSTGRGASAAADFAANKTIALLDGRFGCLFGLDTMGNTAAARGGSVPYTNGSAIIPGSAVGENTHALITAELASHTHTFSATTSSDGAHTHTGATDAGGTHSHTGTTASDGAHTHTGTTSTESAAHTHSGTTGIENATHIHSGTTGGQSNDHTHAGTTGGQSNSHTHTATIAGEAAHTHTGTTDSNGAHTHTVPVAIASSGTAGGGNSLVNSGNTTTTSNGAHTHTFTTGAGASHTHTITIDNTVTDHTHGFTTGGTSGGHTHAFDSGTESATHAHTFTTSSESAAHDHSFTTSSNGAHTHTFTTSIAPDHSHTFTTSAVAHSHTVSGTTGSNGSGTAHNVVSYGLLGTHYQKL